MPMDPHYEQRLRDEVIYLHSLWHQGPTTRLPYPHPHPHLQPSSSTQFKKDRRKSPKHKKSKNKPKKSKNQQPPPEVSGIEWPCQPISDPSPAGPSGWPAFTKTQLNSEPHLPPSPLQQAWFFANQSQFKALKAVNEFFKSINSDYDTDDDEDELMDDEEEEVENEGSEDSHLGFFAKLFEEDGELREFYEKNYENGEFSCLVCGGVGKNKRFKDCVALVQHTITIAKTKKRKAHRAYGQVICKVLGWEIDKLPSIVSLISEKRNGLSSKSGEGEGEAQVNLDNGNNDIASNVVDIVDSVKDNNDEEIRGMESIGADKLPDNGNNDITSNVVDIVDSIKDNNDEEIRGKESIGAEQLLDNDESVVSEILFVSDPNTVAEDLSKGVAEGVQGNTESSHNSMEPCKEENADGKEADGNQKTNTIVDDPKESDIQN